jgi:hypothetical protein
MDWRAIDPTIFGTLFERGLDPRRARPHSAPHYTDTETIAKLIDPLIREPLLAEWGRGQGRNAGEAERRRAPSTRASCYASTASASSTRHAARATSSTSRWPRLRDVEKRAHVDAQELGLGAELVMHTGPHNILGLEINDFAAELARVTVWIGDIQWCRRNG